MGLFTYPYFGNFSKRKVFPGELYSSSDWSTCTISVYRNLSALLLYFLYSESLPELLVPQSFGIKCSHRFVGAAVPMRLWEQLFPLICGHGSFHKFVGIIVPIHLWEQLFPQICRNSIVFIILLPGETQ